VDEFDLQVLFDWQSRGGGFELEIHYPQWRRVHKPIDRHHNLLDSLAKLIEGNSNDFQGRGLNFFIHRMQ